jgi:hypothetical protein
MFLVDTGQNVLFSPTDCVTEVRHVLPLSIQGDTQMLWAGIFAGGAGLLLSARYRVGALIAAGMLGVLGMLCVSPFANWTAAATLVNTLAMLCSLNAGYLLGFAISCARARSAVKSGSETVARHHAVADNGRMAIHR